MSCKEFVRLVEDNIIIMDRLSDRVRRRPVNSSGYPRQQLSILVRLYMGGQAKLKDIAMREMIPTPNLCAAFRKLEHEGLVSRKIDDADRRNTWYDVTPRGAELAQSAMENLRIAIAQLFGDLSREDEKQMIAAMKTINGILTKMELGNA